MSLTPSPNPLDRSALILRPTDLLMGRTDPRRGERVLAWKATCRMPDVARKMIHAS